MKYFKSENLEKNLKLRAEYRKKRHQSWSKQDQDKKILSKVSKIKEDLLQLEQKGERKFYRYLNCFDWDLGRLKSEISDLKNKNITLVNPTKFNDPYDCYIPNSSFGNRVNNCTTVIKYQTSFRRELEDIYSEYEQPLSEKESKEKVKRYFNNYRDLKFISESIGSIKKNLYISCFSNNPLDMYFWSHYGGCHSGICIEYTFSKDLIKDKLHPVQYSRSYPQDLRKLSNGANFATALVKSMSWVHELEWRFIAFNDSRKEDYVKSELQEGSNISAIYLGLDFEKRLEEERKKWSNILLNKFILFDDFVMHLQKKPLFQVLLAKNNSFSLGSKQL